MEVSAIIFKLVLLVIVVSAYLGMRRNPKKEIRFFFVWVAIIALLVLGYTILAPVAPPRLVSP